LKILLVDIVYGHSSTGKLMMDIKTGLENKGHNVIVAYGRDDSNETVNVQNSIIKVANKTEVFIHAAMTRLTGLTGFFSPLATIKLQKLIDQFKPDIVHLHEIHGYFVNIYAITNYLKEKKIPTLWTFHSEFMYTGNCGHSYDCEQWLTECVKCPQLHAYPQSWFFDFTNLMFHKKKVLFENFDLLRITTVSEWLKKRVKNSFLSEKRVDVVYNGIDTDNIFYPRDSAKLKDKLGIKSKFIIISVGPDLMSEAKGGKWILEVAKKLSNMDITFVMIGVDNPEEIVRENVVALPKISDQDELAHYYSLGNLFLLTSHKETFSLVCVESLACGTPVVGFEAGAPSEIVPKEYGDFVTYGDVDLLSSTLIHYLNNPSLLSSSQECYAYANSNFGKNIMVQNYENIYFEMIAQ